MELAKIERPADSNYTDDQWSAIAARKCNILVSAAAGSGKTRVLVDRIIGRILARECEIDELLVMTFTEMAALEMRERIEKSLARALAEARDAEEIKWLDRQAVLLTGAAISTMHGFCQRVIRQHVELLSIDPQFRIAGEQEINILKHDVWEELLETIYQEQEQGILDFMEDYGSERGDDEVKGAVLALYNFSQSQPEPDKWLERQLGEAGRGETVWSGPWGELIWQDLASGCACARDSLAQLEVKLRRALEDQSIMDKGDLEACLAPYLAAAEHNLEQVESLLQPGKAWEPLRESFQNFKAVELRAKAYKPLKEKYPELRVLYDAYNKEFKGYVTALRDKYFGLGEAELQEKLSEGRETLTAYVELTRAFAAAFQAAKLERNVLDFNDLEHYALAVLKREPETEEEKSQVEAGAYLPSEAALGLRERFKEVMVDEYQDTNSVQEAILGLVTAPGRRFVVGDVKQSIYRFRLANPHLFQSQYEACLGEAGGSENQLITMRKNFRSRAEVLAPINFIFDQLMRREPMEIEYDALSKLYPGADYPEAEHTLAGPVELDIVLDTGAPSETADERADELEGFALEAQHIAERIKALIREAPRVRDGESYRPLAYRDIAVLLRSVRGQADTLLEVLRKNNIPAYADLRGGYFEAREVRLMLDLLRLIDNARQDIPLAAVLTSPLAGFKMPELARLRLLAAEDDLYGALLASQDLESGISSALRERTAAFLARLSRWRNFALSHSVPELIWQLYRETGYYDYVGGLPGGLLRQANLRMLVDRAADYEQTNYRGLFRFLHFFEDLQKRHTDLSVARTLGASENVVRIMSVHKSKGLEFPVVFVAALGKQFNREEAKSTFLFHQELGIGMKLAANGAAGRQRYKTLSWQMVLGRNEQEARAEELRILYVAMTRAREKLILVGTLKVTEDKMAARFGKWCRQVGSEEVQLSRMLINQGGGLLDWIATAVARHKAGRPLREMAELPEEDLDWALEIEPDASFQVHLLPAEDIKEQEAGENEDDAVLQAVRAGLPLPDSESREEVWAKLAWHYEDRGLGQVPAKLTVTEIKQMFTAADDFEEISAGKGLQARADWLQDSPGEWRRPRFMQEPAAKPGCLTAAERGTLLHTVMHHLDLNKADSIPEVHAQLENMEAKGLLQSGEKRYVDCGSIVAFSQSQMGQRLLKAKHVYRELPFSRLLTASNFYRDLPAEEQAAKVFVQGVIDLLFEDEQGRLVLLDYKTDKNTSAEQARERYQVQIELYSQAVEELLQQKVAERYLYLLQSGSLVQL